MKKKCIAVFVAMLLVLTGAAVPEPVRAEEVLSLSAKSAVLMDASTGRILYASNPDEQLAMASTTKIMTALLTLEEAEKENKAVKITREMVQVEGSSMGLKEGNILSLWDLAAGMLAVSGNDAANSAAIAISGSKEGFAEKMNCKARELGMEHTNFVTPSGLDDEEHYSTTRDMAILARNALENPEFASIVSQPTIRVTYQSPEQSYVFTNHNKLLRMYEGCIGVKTGFTKKAGRCLVSAAERNGVRLVAVTLNAPDDWNDHIKLFDYGFSQLSSIRMDESNTTFTVDVVGGTSDQIEVTGSDGGSVVVSAADKDKVERIVLLPNFTYAPFPQGTQLGKISYQLNGEEIGSVPLVTTAAVEQQTVEQGIFQKIGDFFRNLFG